MSDDPVELVVEHDGLRIAALDWGGDGEPLLLLHPTGFCAGFFDPLARRLRDRYRSIGVDLRGHGGSSAPDAAHAFGFTLMAQDVLAVLDHLGVSEWVSLGESGGGGVAVLVDRARPGATKKLVVCEPIAFPLGRSDRQGGDAFEDLPRSADVAARGSNYMADIARKRRPVWPDRAHVRASYASRPPLDALGPEFLDAYVRWGFIDRADGQVELACPPEAEARMFEVAGDGEGTRAAWDHLAHLTCPMTILAGRSSNLPTPWFEAQGSRAGAPVIVVDGGHFFLHEDLDRAERLARDHLA